MLLGVAVAVGVGVVAVGVVVGVEADHPPLVVGDSSVHVDGGVGGGVALEPGVGWGEGDVAVDAVGAHLEDAVVAVEGEVAALAGGGWVGVVHGWAPSWRVGCGGW